MVKVIDRNTSTRCEICSKLTMDTRTTRGVFFWCLYFTHCAGISVANFEQVIAGWVIAKYLWYPRYEDFVMKQ